MAKQGKKSKPKTLSPKQLELERQYNRERANLRARNRYWQKTKRMSVEIPPKPQKITEASIKRLHNIRLESMSEKQVKQAQTNFEREYEKGVIPSPSRVYQEYEPPTEDEFLNQSYSRDDSWWEDTPNEPADSRAEIDRNINDIIDSILNQEIDRPNIEVKDTIERMLNDLREQLGDKGFYEFMSERDRLTRLQASAYAAMSTSPPKGQTSAQNPDARSSIMAFATELNMGTPLSDNQSQELEDLMMSGGNMGDLIFDTADYYYGD